MIEKIQSLDSGTLLVIGLTIIGCILYWLFLMDDIKKEIDGTRWHRKGKFTKWKRLKNKSLKDGGV